MILVTQDLADLGQRRAGAQQLGREGVAQHMRTVVGEVIDARPLQRPPCNVSDAVRRESDMCCVRVQENGTAIGWRAVFAHTAAMELL